MHNHHSFTLCFIVIVYHALMIRLRNVFKIPNICNFFNMCIFFQVIVIKTIHWREFDTALKTACIVKVIINSKLAILVEG